jgi:hypothetical protein
MTASLTYEFTLTCGESVGFELIDEVPDRKPFLGQHLILLAQAKVALSN